MDEVAWLVNESETVSRSRKGGPRGKEKRKVMLQVRSPTQAQLCALRTRIE